MTVRGVETLGSVDAIASEDTRRTRVLLTRYDVRRPLIAYHEHNEERAAAKLVARLLAGDNIALVTDAGTPLVSDPGYRLVALCVREGIRVVPVPGPSAVTAALSAAGLPPQPFHFAGFLPRKDGARRRRLEELSSLDCTLVFYESPHRLAKTLAAMAEVLGDRQAVVARELTKVHEEFVRGTLPELGERYAGNAPKGEIVVLVAGEGAREGQASDERQGETEHGPVL
ncbi:16S rRNA (cytidine(1402)-2'-O)-methyltransferase [bacterium]|nr:16S rRNA (cytidine(1402)-2'-O)-methyltransferase [bacterium]